MTHGLTSRRIVEERAGEVRALAGMLTKGLPQSPPVQEAAAEVAELIFALHAIRRARIDTLTPPTTGASIDDVEHYIGHLERFDSYSETEVFILHQELEEELDSEARQQRLLLQGHQLNKRKIRILDDYERRVYSRYLKLITRLDYLSIEATRTK